MNLIKKLYLILKNMDKIYLNKKPNSSFLIEGNKKIKKKYEAIWFQPKVSC